MQGRGMNYRFLLSNTLTAFAAQGVSMLVSVVMSLLIPKVLGIASYGYWQLFVFYVGYSGFFHFGLNDGIYLVEGGKLRDELDKKAVNSQFIFGLVFQLVVGLVITLFAVLTSPGDDRVFILIAFALYTVINNITALLGYIFQAMNETKLFSFSTMLERLAFLVPMLVLVFMRVGDFRLYVVGYILSKAVSLCFCVWHARDILGSGHLSPSDTVKMSVQSIKVGFSLMIAGVADMLILGVARGLVDYAWGIEAFAVVSFSLSLVNFFITFVSQAAMVLFPALRQGTEDERHRFYVKLRSFCDVIFPAAYLLYFPMVWLLSIWLPQYAESMRYFAMLLPVCVFNTAMSLCCTTYFKVFREERLLLGVNFVTVVVSATFSIVGVYLVGSLDFVLLGVVACIMGRSVWSERHFDRKMGEKTTSVPIQEILLTVAFVVSALTMPAVPAFAFHLVLYVIYLVRNQEIVVTLMGSLWSIVGIR